MLKALFKKQLLELNTFYFVDKKKGTNRSRGGVIGMFILFAFLYLTVGFAFFGMGELLGTALFGTGSEWLYFAIMGLVSLALGVFGSVFNTYSGLYQAKDNDLLLSMPIEPWKILFVRMLGVYVMGVFFAAIAYLPAALVYAIHVGVTLLGVIFSLLLLPLLGLVILALTCALGWLVALIASRLKSKAVVTVLLTFLLLGVYYVCYFRINTYLELLVDHIDLVGEKIRAYVYPFYLFGAGAVGEPVPFLLFLLISLFCFGLCYFILAKTFLRIVTTNRGGKKAVYRERAVKKGSIPAALLAREFKHFVSSPAYMMNCGLGVILLPVLGIVAAVKAADIGNLFASLGEDAAVISGLLPVLIAAAVTFVLPLCCISAPSISLEGSSFWIVRSLPIEPGEILRAKERAHLLLSALPALVATLVADIALGFDLLSILFSATLAVAFAWFVGVVGLLENLRRPSLVWTSEVVPVKQGASVGFTILIAFAGSLGFSSVGCAVALILPPWIALLAATFAFGLITFFLRKKVYSSGIRTFEAIS